MKIKVKEITNRALAIFSLALVGSAPFFRGLFFEREMGVYHYLTAAASILLSILLIRECLHTAGYSLRHSGEKFKSEVGARNRQAQLPVTQLAASPYFLALIVLAGSYGLAFLPAISPREALFAWLRHLDYLLTFVIFFLSIGLLERNGQRDNFIHWVIMVLAVAGSVVALGGILAAQGIIPLQGVMENGRLSSTFQYSNTMAAYLAVTLLMAVHLAAQRQPLLSGAFAAMGFLTLLAVLGSQSRGVWLLLPVIFGIFCLGQNDKKHVIIVTAGILGLAVLLSSRTVTPLTQQTGPDWIAFFWTLAGAAAAGVWGGWAQKKKTTTSPLTSKNIKIIIFSASVVLLVTIAGAALLTGQTHTVHNAGSAGNPLLTRALSINPESSTLRERLVIYSDAVKMALERPLSGWGGGGWMSGYRAYQSYLYNSAEAHNHFIQVWVEAGTLGLLAILLPFIALGYGLLCLYRARKTLAPAQEVWTVGVAALFLGMHSLIDFDLSFSSVALLLWALLAVFAYAEGALGFGLTRKLKDLTAGLARGLGRKGRPCITLLFSLCLFALSIHLLVTTLNLRTAEAMAQASVAAMQKGEEAAALEKLRAAGRLDPYRAEYLVSQAQLLMAQAERSAEPRARENLTGESLKLARKAVDLDGCNASHRFFLARICLADGRTGQAVMEAERAKALQPWVVTGYENLCNIYMSAAMQERALGRKEPFEDALRRVIAAAEEAAGKKNTLPARLRSLWDPYSADLVLTPQLAMAAGQSSLLLGDADRAGDYFDRVGPVSDAKSKAVLQLWAGAAALKAGDPSGAAMMESALKITPEAEEEYLLLKQFIDEGG